MNDEVTALLPETVFEDLLDEVEGALLLRADEDELAPELEQIPKLD